MLNQSAIGLALGRRPPKNLRKQEGPLDPRFHAFPEHPLQGEPTQQKRLPRFQ